MFEIKGSKQTYVLKIDLKHKALIHNCEDWLHRGMQNYQLCKHYVRIFQELFEEEAKEIVTDVLVNSWAFVDSDDYLKKV